MENRNIIKEKIKFNIPFDKYESYKGNITWGDIQKIKELQPTDIIYQIDWKKELRQSFFSMDMDDSEHYLYIPQITIIRRRLENDEEFLQRLKNVEQRKKEQELKDKEEYLRLKAKFEQ